jgi:hypothetical protein
MQAADGGHTSRGEHLPPLKVSSPTRSRASPTTRLARSSISFSKRTSTERSARAFQIPPSPPEHRARLGQTPAFCFHRALLLPPLTAEHKGTQGRDLTLHVRPRKTPRS